LVSTLNMVAARYPETRLSLFFPTARRHISEVFIFTAVGVWNGDRFWV